MIKIIIACWLLFIPWVVGILFVTLIGLIAFFLKLFFYPWIWAWHVLNEEENLIFDNETRTIITWNKSYWINFGRWWMDVYCDMYELIGIRL